MSAPSAWHPSQSYMLRTDGRVTFTFHEPTTTRRVWRRKVLWELSCWMACTHKKGTGNDQNRACKSQVQVCSVYTGNKNMCRFMLQLCLSICPMLDMTTVQDIEYLYNIQVAGAKDACIAFMPLIFGQGHFYKRAVPVTPCIQVLHPCTSQMQVCVPPLSPAAKVVPLSLFRTFQAAACTGGGG
jgi:hypothetical protein